jgi:hypothetical protein
MSKPDELIQLLEELKSELRQSSVETNHQSRGTLFLGPDDEVGLELSAAECSLLLATPSTVHRMSECLPDPEAASIHLFDLTITDPVRDALERALAAVDEG